MARRVKATSDKFIRVKGFWFNDTSESTDIKEYTVKQSRHSENGFLVDENGCLVDGEMVEIVEILGPAVVLSPVERLAAQYPTIGKLKDALRAAHDAGSSVEDANEKVKPAVTSLISALSETTSVPASFFPFWLGESRVQIRFDAFALWLDFAEEDRFATIYDSHGCDLYEHWDDCSISEFVKVVGMHLVDNAKVTVADRLAEAKLTLALAQALKIEGV